VLFGACAVVRTRHGERWRARRPTYGGGRHARVQHQQRCEHRLAGGVGPARLKLGPPRCRCTPPHARHCEPALTRVARVSGARQQHHHRGSPSGGRGAGGCAWVGEGRGAVRRARVHARRWCARHTCECAVRARCVRCRVSNTQHRGLRRSRGLSPMWIDTASALARVWMRCELSGSPAAALVSAAASVFGRGRECGVSRRRSDA
jgi:hypothetical protein